MIQRNSMKISKFINGGFAGTIHQSDKEFKPVRFDLSIFLDTGIYLMSKSSGIVSTSAGSAIEVESIDGTTIFRKKDLEDEQGLRYSFVPKYAQNFKCNKQSRFVHYSSTDSVDGNRQTFKYAYMTAIKTVKEVFESEYFIEKFGKILPQDSSTQVRTLLQEYEPTAELMMRVIDKQFKKNEFIILLCIMSVYFLEKTFVLDKLEMNQLNAHCESIMRHFDSIQSMLTDKEYEIYLTFLFLLATSRVYTKNQVGQWTFENSKQKVFYHNIDFKPISYQSKAIDSHHIKIHNSIKKIEEDIMIMLGYHRIIGKPYGTQNTMAELRFIIDLFIDPNIVGSEAYSECVKQLLNYLNSASDLKAIENVTKIVKDIPFNEEDALAISLARKYVRDLYKNYPMQYYRYIQRCLGEVNMPILKMPVDITTGNVYINNVVPFEEGLSSDKNELNLDFEPAMGMQQYDEDSDMNDNDYVTFGYSLIYDDDNALVPNKKKHLEYLRGFAVGDQKGSYRLNHSPALLDIINKSTKILNEGHDVGGSVDDYKYVSRFEFLFALCKDLMQAIENTPRSTNCIKLDYNKFASIIDKFIEGEGDIPDDADLVTSEMIQRYATIKKLKRVKSDLAKKPEILTISRFISHAGVSYSLDANLFVLAQLSTTLLKAVNREHTTKHENEVLPEEYRDALKVEAYSVMSEVARQFLAFLCDFLKQINQYVSIEDFVTKGESEVDEDGRYHLTYQDREIFDLNSFFESIQGGQATDQNIIEAYKSLSDYFNEANSILRIEDIALSAHIERKDIVYGKPYDSYMAGVAGEDLADLWEPHNFRVKISVPYACYVDMKQNTDRGASNYTTIMDLNSSVKPWEE